MERYTKGIVLGVGTFGKVLMATDKETGQVVAIKKIQVGEKGEGVNVTALREVKLLRELRSPYLVRLLEVLPQKRGINLVMEYCESDLEHVIRDRSRLLSAGDIKAYMQMILRALEFCHSRWVVHRDIKPNNFLVTASGELKLADFGLARTFGSPDRRYTNQVFARWYRPPELFYGSTCYGPGVDIWAAGCIFAELLRRNPWFSGESDLEVLGKIYNALGTPQDEGWAGLRAMPGFVEFQATPAPGLRKLFPASMIGASDDALDLLSRMMAFDASRRISAADALQHRYFRSDPPPSSVEQLPKPQQRQAPAAGAAAGATTDDGGAATGGAAAESDGQQGAAAAAQGQQQQEEQPAAGGQQGSDASPSAASGAADPQQAAQQQGAAASGGTPLFGGLPLSAVPESMLGRVERPKLDSSDIQFFKKRKFNLDDAEGA
ncbi:Cyclin-dependent kinase D-1 [Chlorella sorokiniana]|uniref:[RNA-polymerase]-subunit kinase n=1 Tax=Chlorella sorokiniana TaxID=3076 RepID=A0A2P6TQB8_CHLSO|nr:Cyclin-dependent kinase D-1 [Chlorella sorokiniana]|eukprot:PRW56229.1 Cyclin-dependent kinase D-1 [Chlorella sorokiniana]